MLHSNHFLAAVDSFCVEKVILNKGAAPYCEFPPVPMGQRAVRL
jgi:hypothetical protein